MGDGHEEGDSSSEGESVTIFARLGDNGVEEKGKHVGVLTLTTSV